ncbi:ribose transport system permease protein [Kaistia hirudinis]|uniref:Autoinducer 2 import system permease protein LsrD n=1 Tax=Kaistia hirudinis TaxID=1293440 RepID=A0A840AS81_9HYPH|nr:ABC transporter permease [Kaistia hirudinis]MBB3932512.1 ribose transport system permease protein [Kaistia hirudinis]
MTLADTLPASRRTRRSLPVPLLLFLASAVLYVGAALYTGQLNQLGASGLVGLAQRMVGLGIVALGQTFVILAGSIDLSVANLISVSAVLASFVMQGDPAMIAPAVLLVLVVSAAVGFVNGGVVAKLGVNPLIATLGVGLILQGLLSASFNNFAGSVPEAFQGLAYGTIGIIPWSVLALLALAIIGALLLRSTRFGAHLYATGGNMDGARLAGIRTDRITILAHVICSLMAGLTGLYLASRLRSGAPWVGRDGVYDLESIAVVVIGGTLLSGGRGGVWGTLAGVLLFATLDAVFNMLGVPAFPKQVMRGAIVILAVAAYAIRNKGPVA